MSKARWYCAVERVEWFCVIDRGEGSDQRYEMAARGHDDGAIAKYSMTIFGVSRCV